MTFREKLQMEHPEKIGKDFDGGCSGCPDDYGYEETVTAHKDCFLKGCRECWDREIPEPNNLEDAMKAARDAAKEATTAVTDMKKSVEQLLEEHYSRLIKDPNQQPPKIYISANPRMTTGTILLECAKTIAYECKQNQNCEGCVFLDNEKACIFAPEGGLFPENWMIPLATLADIEREDEADG